MSTRLSLAAAVERAVRHVAKWPAWKRSIVLARAPKPAPAHNDMGEKPMKFFRLVKVQHVRLVQLEDVEAESAEEAMALWNGKTAMPHPQFDHGRIEAIEVE